MTLLKAKMKDTELKRMRDRELYKAYIECLEQDHCRSFLEAIDHARRSPASQFYISSRNLSSLIGKMLAGKTLVGLHSASRRKMYRLFYNYIHFRKEQGSGMTRERICEELVMQPAPEFYVGREMARKIIVAEKKKAVERLKERRSNA